jgi:hypothetical protein
MVVLALASACGGAQPASQSVASPLSVGVQVEALSPWEADGSPRLHASVVARDGAAVVASVDLGVAGVDANSCAASYTSGIPDALDPSAVDPPPNVELVCSGIHTAWHVTLVDRGDHVEIWTQTVDEVEGTYDAQPDLAVPAGRTVHLEPDPIASDSAD